MKKLVLSIVLMGAFLGTAVAQEAPDLPLGSVAKQCFSGDSGPIITIGQGGTQAPCKPPVNAQPEPESEDCSGSDTSDCESSES